MSEAYSWENVIEALDSVTWYNCLAEYILEWKKFKFDKGLSVISRPKRYGADNSEDEAQLQVIWMMAVEMFGNCGTSPRTGWIEIENVEGFHQFIDDITQLYREARERGELEWS